MAAVSSLAPAFRGTDEKTSLSYIQTGIVRELVIANDPEVTDCDCS
jgi:hypothetical protein